MERIQKNKKTINIIVWMIICIVLAVICINNIITSPEMWFDESGQFWLAKGLHHYSNPLSESGTIQGTIQSNRYFNLDPGGYTILLRWWLMISNTVEWMRTLSVVFFLLSYFFIYKISKHLLADTINWIAPFIPLIILTQQGLLYYAFEIRAFSMEYCGLAIAAWYLLCVDENNWKNSLLFGSVMALFMTGRYSFVIITASVGFVLLLRAIQSKKISQWVNIFLYGIPLIVMGLIILLGMMQYQNPGGTSPSYVRAYMLTNNSQGVKQIIYIIGANLIHYHSIFKTIYFMFVGWIMISKQWEVLKTKEVCVYLLIIDIINIILSLLGLYPWFVGGRWNLYLQMSNVVAFVCLVIDGYIIFEKNNRKYQRVFLSALVAMGVVSLIFGFAFRYNVDGHNGLAKDFETLAGQNIMYDQIYITKADQPTVKYIFEYGTLADKKEDFGYPEKFVFEFSDLGKPKENIELKGTVVFCIQSGEIEEIEQQYNLRLTQVSNGLYLGEKIK